MAGGDIYSLWLPVLFSIPLLNFSVEMQRAKRLNQNNPNSNPSNEMFPVRLYIHLVITMNLNFHAQN